MDGYLTKPLNPLKLIDVLQNHIEIEATSEDLEGLPDERTEEVKAAQPVFTRVRPELAYQTDAYKFA